MKKLRNLEKALDDVFGLFTAEEQRAQIIRAVQRDIEAMNVVGEDDDVSKILPIFNSVFDKKFRVLTKRVILKYREILNHYSIADIEKAMRNAKEDEFHKEKKYRHCTPEYFSRIEQMEKWYNASVEKTEASTFVMPKFNVKQ